LLPSALAARTFGQLRPGPRQFRVNVPQATLDRIMKRVRETRLPDRLDAPDWRYGANWAYMKELTEYWTTQFDWRKAEANINRYPQYMARIGGYDIHFYHVRGQGPNPLPVVFTHGWPGSAFEFLETIGPLTDPARFGGSSADAFDVVIPSLPGYGFSSKPEAPIGPSRISELWHQLMTDVIGYSRYGAQGGDWGNAVTRGLAAVAPQSVVAIHLNGCGAVAVAANDLTDEERAWLAASAAYRAQEMDYFSEQQHKPGTVAFALYDNPLGTAAWIVEKFKVWSDSGTNIESVFTKDQLLTNVMIYLVTDTIATSVWLYRGFLDQPLPPGPLTTPFGFAAFPAEMTALNPPQSLLSKTYNLVRYTKMPHGGHFAAFEQPQLFVNELRAFFRMFRT
jgi:pimeloyl-ACP methyl ester carboxylesterase